MDLILSHTFWRNFLNWACYLRLRNIAKRKLIYVSNLKLQKNLSNPTGQYNIDSTNPVKILQSPEGSHYWQIFSLSTFWQNICWHKIVIKLSLWSNFRFLRIKKSFVNSRRLWFEDRHLWLCRPIAEARFAWLSLIPYSRKYVSHNLYF